MSTETCEKDNTAQKRKICPTNVGTTTRSLFTRETGQALIALGTFFKHIPPFNETIDKNTGDTLISIGIKLKK